MNIYKRLRLSLSPFNYLNVFIWLCVCIFWLYFIFFIVFCLKYKKESNNNIHANVYVCMNGWMDGIESQSTLISLFFFYIINF